MNTINFSQAHLRLAIAGCILLQSTAAFSANTCTGKPGRAPVKAVCGRIFNPIGEVPANAELSLTNESDATQYRARINEKGAFSFAPVSPGNYTLRATAPGYLPEQRKIQITRNKHQTCTTMIEVKLGLVACGGGIFIEGFDKRK